MRIIKIIFLSVVCLIFYGCPSIDDVDSTIYIKNNSQNDIYFWERGKNPELLWKPNETFLIPSQSTYILKGNYLGAHSDGSKFYIWLFDREVINNTPWEEVVENERYLIRYELTLQKIKALNWEVIYDGN
jgi:hypothetical protein